MQIIVDKQYDAVSFLFSTDDLRKYKSKNMTDNCLEIIWSKNVFEENTITFSEIKIYEGNMRRFKDTW